MNYIYKRISPEFYKDLVYISKSAFNIDPGIEYYKRKNDTSKFGEPFLGFIAYSEEGEPAAFYGVYAHPVILDGIEYKAAQSGDTMTHKSHTGKGLFTILAKLTYQLAKDSGIDFIFGFPNYNSYPGFVKKLDWTCPGQLKEFRSYIYTLPLSKLAKKIKIINYLYKPYLNFISDFFKIENKSFDSSVIEEGVGGVRRTNDFIKYKSYSGAKMISIRGVCVWFKVDGFMFIGDIEKLPECDIKSVWSSIKKMCFFMGIDTILFQLCPGVYLEKRLSSFLKPKDALPYGYLNLSGRVDPEKFKYVFGDIDTF